MSGLLQRLAARATGTAWTVRSDARLPFATASTGAPAHGDGLPAWPPSPENAASPQAPADPMAPPRRHAAAPGAQAPGLPPQAAATPPHPEPPPLLQPPIAARPGLVHGAARPAPFAETPLIASTHADPLGAPPHVEQATPSPHRAATPREAFSLQADPAPLLPPRAASPTRPAANMPSTPAAVPRPAPAAADTSTEVHIHIGRIEVTALPTPAPPRRPARERTQPMSLDAYLARRKESP